jgi:adenine-specific DNA-methyltransferase
MSLSLDDLRFARDPAGIAKLYRLLGYNADPEPVANTPTEALFEGAVLADLEGVYMLVDEADFQAVHFECKTALHTALIRRVSENFLKRSGYYLLSFRDKNNPNTVFVKPSRSDARVKITRLTLNPQRPSQHEFTVLKEITLTGKSSALEIHARQVKAFDVERVTKKFFETYHDLFERLRDQIKTLNPNTRIGMLQKNTTDDSPSLHAFTQRLLGRMLFLYFIQKKGWLNSQKHWGDGQQDFIVQLYKTRVQSEAVNFYRDILEPLFFETLNRQRQNHISQFGRIPYLNGSLFEREYPETTVLNLPNALFDPSNTDSVLGILERFNFTIEESSSLEQDVSLDPEMLGKVFENLMESDEAAKSGTFYTPRSIVQFLAEESLTRYLSDTTQIDLSRLRQLTSDDDEYGNLERQEADDIIKALAAVRVLDPAVGTASMLVGMLNVMIRIRRSAEARRGMRVQLGTPVIGDWKKQYINHCLYGVDIKQEAIEIGRLRLWLSLVVDAQEPEPLPNLDYKLMAGDGVLETMDGTRFGDTGALLGEDAKINDLIKRIEFTRDAFFSEESPLERKKKRDVLMQLERELFGFDVDWRVKNLDEEITILRRRAHNKKGDTAKDLEMTTRLNTLVDLKNKVLQDLEPLPFFLHRVHFSEVMQRQNAGFDIMLGNPPYVSIINMEAAYKTALKTAFKEVESGRADLYVYFFAKAYELLRENGRVAFITPNKFLRAGYGEKLRGFMTSKTTLEVLVDFGDLPVFDATTYPFITIARKTKPEADTQFLMLPERTLKDRIGDARDEGVASVREALNAFHDYAPKMLAQTTQSSLQSAGWVLDDPNIMALLEKLKSIGQSLGDFVENKIYRGIVTGHNESFVIDRATRDELIAADPKSADVIKPFLRGRDVKRWNVQFAEKYIILVKRGFPLENYPAIKKRLEGFKKPLSSRATIHTHP